MYRFSVWNFFSQLKVKTSHLHKKPQEHMYLRSAAPCRQASACVFTKIVLAYMIRETQCPE